MTEPVNLNRFRKNKARAAKAARALENTVTFGRTKAQKEVENAPSSKQSESGQERNAKHESTCKTIRHLEGASH